ncbi:unnamed protein product [Gadus morhua 'NCC']
MTRHGGRLTYSREALLDLRPASLDLQATPSCLNGIPQHLQRNHYIKRIHRKRGSRGGIRNRMRRREQLNTYYSRFNMPHPQNDWTLTSNSSLTVDKGKVTSRLGRINPHKASGPDRLRGKREITAAIVSTMTDLSRDVQLCYCTGLSPPAVLSAEFSRIVTKDMLESFLDGLDALVPGVLQMYGEAAASGRRVRLSSVLSCLQKEAHGETLDVLMSGMQVGLLIGHEGPLHDAFTLDVFNVALVVEEKIILHDLRDVSTGFAMLLGAIYCLNLEYPHLWAR